MISYWFFWYNLDIQLNHFRPIKPHCMECFKEAGQGELNGMIRGSPTTHNDARSEDLYLWQTDPPTCAVGNGTRENIL
ncbi:MAG: hypothetical protein WCJ35_01390 [Planctomycetota bacterium]